VFENLGVIWSEGGLQREEDSCLETSVKQKVERLLRTVYHMIHDFNEISKLWYTAR
jgi:hypothetical protein